MLQLSIPHTDVAPCTISIRPCCTLPHLQAQQQQQQQLPPDWAMPSSAPTTRFGITCSTSDPSSTTDWTRQLPEYQPSLAALSTTIAGPASPAAGDQPLSSQQVLQSFVDSEANIVTQQVWEIADAVRLQASHGVDLSQQQGARRSRAKLLFHHQPYATQVGQALVLRLPPGALVCDALSASRHCSAAESPRPPEHWPPGQLHLLPGSRQGPLLGV
jgi:hypothetical protein